MKIPLIAFEEHLGDDALEWAFNHLEKSKLKTLQPVDVAGDDALWAAEVTDGRGRGAAKSITLQISAGHLLSATCSCNTPRDPICRHAALALMALAARAAGTPVAGDGPAATASSPKRKPATPRRKARTWSIETAIEDMGEEELRALVRIWSASESRMSTAILLSHGHKDPKESKAKYGKALKAVLASASGRGKNLPVAIQKEIARIFDGFLDAVDRHFEADRFRTGCLQLVAIVEELIRMSIRMGHVSSVATATPWQRALALTARAAGVPSEASERKEVVKAWHKLADVKAVGEGRGLRNVLAAAAVLASSRAEQAERIRHLKPGSDDDLLISGFLDHLEGNTSRAAQQWRRIEDLECMDALTPHFFFRGEHDEAQKWAERMVAQADPGDYLGVQDLLEGWQRLLTIAQAKPEPDLTLADAAHAALLVYDADNRKAHFEAVVERTSIAERIALGRRLREFGQYSNLESLQEMLVVLAQLGCASEMVDMAFRVVSKGLISIVQLFPISEIVRGPMANMWTEFIEMEAVRIVERGYPGYQEERRLVACMQEMKDQLDPLAYNRFRKEVLRSAHSRYMIERIVENAEESLGLI